MASTYLSRTSTSATLATKYTISFWVKRSKPGADMRMFNNYVDGNASGQLYFNATDQLNLYDVSGGSSAMALVTNRKFKDTNAFYHIVIAVDTTQNTSSDRAKIYVNGTQETSLATSTYPSQDHSLSMQAVSASGQRRIGSNNGPGDYFDGSLAHFHFIDGLAYAASTFGETDSTSGIWVPKTSPSVTYGNNGFFLKFANSGNMDLDSSGNNLTFTTSGTLTQNVDTPSNNACIINAISNEASGFTFANANTSATFSSGSWKTIQGTLGANKGKWYYETKWNGTGSYMAGWTSSNFMDYSPVNYVGHTHAEPSYAIQDGGGVYYSTTSAVTQDSASWGDSFGSSNVLGCAIDIDNGKLYWSKDGVWMNSGVPTSGSTGTGAFSISDTATNYFWQPIMSSYNGAQGMFNFVSGYFGTTQVSSANADANGQGAFEYAVPSGYYALNTKNLKEFG
tara:strand:+ start:176 stop:1531 length:1356 start_codon:yes stop_codon:yes gene_type:complete